MEPKRQRIPPRIMSLLTGAVICSMINFTRGLPCDNGLFCDNIIGESYMTHSWDVNQVISTDQWRQGKFSTNDDLNDCIS